MLRRTGGRLVTDQLTFGEAPQETPSGPNRAHSDRLQARIAYGRRWFGLAFVAPDVALPRNNPVSDRGGVV
jgi:hypothetical protein